MMPNKNGAICLHIAAAQGHVEVVKSLLAKGAAVDAKTKVPPAITLVMVVSFIIYYLLMLS